MLFESGRFFSNLLYAMHCKVPISTLTVTCFIGADELSRNENVYASGRLIDCNPSYFAVHGPPVQISNAAASSHLSLSLSLT